MEQVEVVLAGTPVGACRETALHLAGNPRPLWHGHRGVTGVRPEQLDVLVRGVRLLPEVAPNLDALEVPARAGLVAAIPAWNRWSPGSRASNAPVTISTVSKRSRLRRAIVASPGPSSRPVIRRLRRASGTVS